MRSVILATLLVACSHSAYASWQGNWLVGVSGIYAQRRGELDLSMRYVPPFPVATPVFPILEADNLYTNKGFGWGLLAGYQLKSDGWTWGFEGSVDWHDITATRDVVFTDVIGLFSWDATSRYEREPIAALSGRMAYEMAPYFIPYMRLGIEGSHDSLDVTVTGNPFILVQPNISVSDSRWNWHYLAGIGIETPLLCTQASVRIEYNYHSRGRPLIVNGIFINQGVSFSSEMHNRTHSGKLSLVWNFS
ncbi:MAG: outer membrane protein [Candidatus Berkiella sp.]